MIRVKRVNLAIALVASISFTVSCKKADESDCIKGEGTIITKTLEIPSFTRIDLSFASNVIVTEGASQVVTATGHPNIIDRISTTVSGNLWDINLIGEECYEDYQLSVNITIPSIEALELSGSGNLVVNDFSSESALIVSLTGSGNITLNDFDGIVSLNSELAGSGNLTFNKDIASLNKLNLTNSGSGNSFGYELDCDTIAISSTGSGNCQVKCSEILSGEMTGSGDVYYKGAPSISIDNSGSGNLIDAN